MESAKRVNWKTDDNPNINPESLLKYDRICRACLNETENMISISHPEIKDMFTFCTSLEVNNDDKFPGLICTQCRTELLRAHNFKDLCIKSNNILMEYISRYKIDDIEINLNDLLRTDFCDTNLNLNSCDMGKDEKIIIDIVDKQINDILEEHIDNNCDDDSSNNSTQSLKEDLHQCNICSETFSLKSHYVKIHMRQHTGELPYMCEICNKGFTQNSQMEIHLRVHTGVKPYICQASVIL
ncbi:hypothetical protein NQ318_001647 [Aromia moschata]|uniref:Zinc finger protein n=1 Tax=Aromia moschata TaxID=1265417 RepID=A0AAV8Y151_9CUCU|nr:hypothetical protein NQ318_001647 [Aromia moschata]